MMPVVRASKRSRVFYNTGHGHLGWTLAGITARMTINLLAQQNYLPTRPRPQWHRGELWPARAPDAITFGESQQAPSAAERRPEPL